MADGTRKIDAINVGKDPSQAVFQRFPNSQIIRPTSNEQNKINSQRVTDSLIQQVPKENLTTLFKSLIHAHPFLLGVLRKNPAIITPFLTNRAMLAAIKVSPSLINIVGHQKGSLSSYAGSTSLVAELAANPLLLSMLKSNPNLQEVRRLMSTYLPDSHYSIYDAKNQARLEVAQNLIGKNMTVNKPGERNLIARAWEVKGSADSARQKFTNAINDSKKEEALNLITKPEAKGIVAKDSVQELANLIALKQSSGSISEQYLSPHTKASPNVTKAGSVVKSVSLNQTNTNIIYDSRNTNINAAYLAYVGSGGAITNRMRRVEDEDLDLNESTPEEFKDSELEVNQIIETLLSRLTH